MHYPYLNYLGTWFDIYGLPNPKFDFAICFLLVDQNTQSPTLYKLTLMQSKTVRRNNPTKLRAPGFKITVLNPDY